MLRKNKKTDKKPVMPTEEEFLQYRPIKGDFEWSVNAEGLVEISVPKFTSNLGKSFCKMLRKENKFIAKLDKIGSIVWQNCDGQKTVREILEILKKELPDEEDIDQRLYLFIQQLGHLNYLNY